MPTAPVLRLKGIILSAIDFKEYDRILNVFSRDEGIVSLIVNGANRSSKGKPLTAPLTYAEFVYSETRGNLLRCREVTPLATHLKLRHSLPLLESACSMLQAVSVSQLPGKASPLLFDLLHAYLQELPKVSDPCVLLESFKLKLLRHEGLLQFENRCSLCEEKPVPLYLFQGECFCRRDAPAHAQVFNEEEALMMELLLISRRFESMSEVELSPEFKERLDNLFKDRIHQ